MPISTNNLTRLGVSLLAIATLSACASKPKYDTAPVATPTPPVASAPPAAPTAPVASDSAIRPGSTQDFVINVGDRVYFDVDQSGLRADARALLDAQPAMDYLVSRGVTPNRITTISYGKEQPVATDASDEAWAKNRNARTSITEGAR